MVSRLENGNFNTHDKESPSQSKIIEDEFATSLTAERTEASRRKKSIFHL